MFCYQHHFTDQCEVLTSDKFSQMIVSDSVTRKVKQYRENLPVMKKLIIEIEEVNRLLENTDPADTSAVTDLKKRKREAQQTVSSIKKLKSTLPKLMYQATFDESVSKKGFKGKWRKQSASRLNGLFMLDVDHIEKPIELFKSWVDKHVEENDDLPIDYVVQRTHFCNSLGIMLVHVTPSGEGLRIVAKADMECGNIADNQLRLSKLLGVEPDKACKDACRCSFCPSFEDVLFINKEIFDYDNKEYDQKFGDLYRKGNSCATRSSSNSVLTGNTGSVGSGVSIAVGSEQGVSNVLGGSLSKNIQELIKNGYHGVSYETIIDKWFTMVNGGRPASGDRHRVLYQAAADLRYITDFNKDLLAGILSECGPGKEMCDEGSRDEIDRIASDACALQRWRSIPKRMQAVLDACGIRRIEPASRDEAPSKNSIDYEYWYQQLRPLLNDSPGYFEAVKQLPPHHQLAGILAAGAMFGSYLSRIWWEHFDGKDYRLSFLVYIIGGAASGKSFIVELDRLIMEPMLAADRVGREWERQFKEEMKKRAASGSKNKGEAPEQQHPVIRYVPSTISNAMLYRRLMDAVDDKVFGSDGQPLHLHVYTMEPELATALRAQTGSWAGKNDLELKSFHNEFAGVDYANDQSVNGVIQVNWNQVVSGTGEAMSRKIKPSTVLDGLVTRLALFPMPNNDFAMIEKRKAIRDHERDAYLRSIGLKLEGLSGLMDFSKLVDYCYKYEEQLAQEARIENDYCLDYFRKRIPVIMMRYTIVRIILREIDDLLKGEKPKVIDSDYQFAKLIGDWCLNAQIHMFGEMVMQAQMRERDAFVPRKRHSRVREMYAQLPELITTATLVENGFASDINSASLTLRRWYDDGLLTKEDRHTYKKKYKEIPV